MLQYNAFSKPLFKDDLNDFECTSDTGSNTVKTATSEIHCVVNYIE